MSTSDLPTSAGPPPGSDGPTGGRRALLGLLVLLVVPLFLRTWPIAHGGGTNYLADTHMVKGALGMAAEKNPVPPVGKYSTYPNLLPYMLLPVYGAQFGVGRLTGRYGGAKEFEMKVTAEPAIVHLPARILVAFFGALTPLLVYHTCRAAGLRAGAWIAAWLVATGLLHVHFSVQERPWTPLVFFFALSALFAARAVRDGDRRAFLASGIAAALAFASHQAGLVGLGIPAVAWLAFPNAFAGGAWKGHVLRGIVCVVAFAVVAVLVGHPYYLVHGMADTSQVAAGDQLAERAGWCFSIGGQAVCLQVSGHTFVRLSKAFFGYDPVLVVLALGGVVLGLRRRALLPGLVFGLGWAAFFLTNYNDHVRYLLPLSVLLAPAAGALADRVWGLAPARALVLLLCALPLVQALRLGQVLRRDDTRTLAAEYLIENPVEGGVAVDAYGPELPLDGPSLERLLEWRDLGRREGQRAMYYADGVEPPGPRGVDAMPVTALFESEIRDRSSWVRADALERYEALGSTPDEVFAALGLTHLLVVDRAPGDGQPSVFVDPDPAADGAPKLAPLSIEPEPLVVFDPSRGATPEHARLPTEMEFPLTGLWRVERPGPLLALHRLR